MGKKDYGYVLSVYRFMQYCGLECPKRPNILVSHAIMLGKLRVRHEKMPDKVIMPTRTTRESVKKEDIKTSRVVLVEDDYGNKLPYYVPNQILSLEEVSQEELAKRREKTLAEALLEGEKPSLGEQRYLERKKRKLELEKRKNALREEKENLEKYPRLKKEKVSVKK